MIATKARNKRRQRRGAPWTDEEELRLMAISHLPPRVIADMTRRSWLACRRRLVYLRASGDDAENVRKRRAS
jgi:hypothetical protein